MDYYSKSEFEKLYKDFGDQIFRYFLVRLKDRKEALDLTQDVFIRLWEYRDKSSITHPKAFLYTVAHNLYVNALRGRRPVYSLDEMMEEGGFDVASHEHERLGVSLDAASLLVLVDELPEEYRHVLFLHYVDDKRVKEIAVELEESENTIAVRLHRARLMLKKKVETQGTKEERPRS